VEELPNHTEALQFVFSTEEFVVKTQCQLVKDFGQYHLTFPDNFSTQAFSKAEITSLIEENVATILEEGETRLLQLLYTIDLSEKIFLALTLSSDFIQLISAKILEREAYKVYLKRIFSA
jgi:hypothetical protein